MDESLVKILVGSGSASAVLTLAFFFIRYLIGQVKEARDNSSIQAQADREIYLKSHEQTVSLTREIAIETQRHLTECHKENQELSARLGRLEVRYSDLSLHIVKAGLHDPRTNE